MMHIQLQFGTINYPNIPTSFRVNNTMNTTGTSPGVNYLYMTLIKGTRLGPKIHRTRVKATPKKGHNTHRYKDKHYTHNYINKYWGYRLGTVSETQFHCGLKLGHVHTTSHLSQHLSIFYKLKI